jgi:LacI family gluconate utilization system Gnt-I transcriptional repressor
MADVATRVGVSAITVSRAFKAPDKVTPDLKARIEAVANELGFVPNRAASALASARSMNVAVLIPSLTNAVFVDTVASINAVLRPRDYQILIGVSDYSAEEEERLLRAYLQYMPDGVLMTGLDHTAETWALLKRWKVPTVHMMELSTAADINCVGFSQEAAGQALTDHLLARGCRRIAYVGAQMDPRTLARCQGYRRALTRAGLYDPGRELLVPTPSSIGLGGELLERLLAQVPDVDAAFFCNDDLAQGALYRCARLGIAVPDRIAVAGFNDLPASAWTVPTLTTINTPRRIIGREAAAMLLALIDGDAPQRTAIDVGFTLMARESA